jgi:hypothetical protein
MCVCVYVYMCMCVYVYVYVFIYVYVCMCMCVCVCGVCGFSLCRCMINVRLQRHNRGGLSLPEVCAMFLHNTVDTHVLPSFQRAFLLQWKVHQHSTALFIVTTLSHGVCSTSSIETLLSTIHKRSHTALL